MMQPSTMRKPSTPGASGGIRSSMVQQLLKLILPKEALNEWVRAGTYTVLALYAGYSLYRKISTLLYLYRFKKKQLPSPLFSPFKSTLYRLKMKDGAHLYTTLCLRSGHSSDAKLKTCILRTPYPRSSTSISRVPYSRILTSRTVSAICLNGYAVVIQDVRGRVSSDGHCEMLGKCTEDSLELLKWIQDQPWASGEVISMDISYQGKLPLALAYLEGKKKGLLPDIKLQALCPCFASSSTCSTMNEGGPPSPINRKISGSFPSLSLSMASTVSTDFEEDMEPEIPCPVISFAGWYDPFLYGQLEDFKKLRTEKRRLVIGPWANFGMLTKTDIFRLYLESTFKFLEDTEDNRVNCFVMYGADGVEGEWRTFAHWPPLCLPLELKLSGGHMLCSGSPKPLSSCERIISYDPMDPTPSVGGATFHKTLSGRIQDQKKREVRADVLTFTTPPLADYVEIIGYVEANLSVSAPRNADIFLTLCDVDEQGVSRNVCDGIVRVGAPLNLRKAKSECSSLAVTGPVPLGLHERLSEKDTMIDVNVKMGPTAKRFLPGHRIRLQVSCGAYPRYHRFYGDSLQDPDEPTKPIRPFLVTLNPLKNLITLPRVPKMQRAATWVRNKSTESFAKRHTLPAR